MAYRHVTIEEAQAIAESHGLDQIVIWHFTTGEGQHTTTWGKNLRHSALAAEAGNYVKDAAGWPLKHRQDLPASLAALFADWEESLGTAIADGTLHKGSVLATLMYFRDAVRRRDPNLAEQLIMDRCEAAQPGGPPP